MTDERVVGRVCRCGHPESDHEGDCAYGWTNEADEAECDCTEFRLAFVVVEDR